MNAIASFAKGDPLMAFVAVIALVIVGAGLALKGGKPWGWLFVAAGGGLGFMTLKWNGWL